MTDTFDTVVDALATFRLTRLVTEDSWPPVAYVRERIWSVFPPNGRTVTSDDGWHVDRDRDTAYRWVRLAGVDMRVEVPVHHTVAASIVTRSHPIGELVGCPWCISAYVSIVVVASRAWMPRRIWNPIARVLAMSAVTGIVSTH